MEPHNPEGFVLALEIEYAKALEKEIILIKEHPDHDRQKYIDMIRKWLITILMILECALIFLNSQEFKV
jgi:hypothetical protein